MTNVEWNLRFWGRVGSVLWNDLGTGVMRHADAGYEIAIQCAKEQGLDLPMV